jgi:DNA-binding response OmpR family regulator
MKKILLIEDDAAIALGIQTSLQAEHYHVTHAADGDDGFSLALKHPFDVIILDWMLPSKNGKDICRDLREKTITTPILMLTSKADEADKVLLLELGADDYLTKPFSIKELHARIKAILRRTEKTEPATRSAVAFGNIEVDFDRADVRKKNKPVKLSAKEFELLKFFLAKEGLVVSRDTLLIEVWGYTYKNLPDTRTVDNYILSLRKKLEDNPAVPKHFLTHHSAGYKFVK